MPLADMSAPTPTPTPQHNAGALPVMAVIQGDIRRDVVIEHIPFSVGRKTDKDLVISDPRVSRDHAEIISESDHFYLVDLGSKHGTFVNGQKVQRHKLERNDRIEFGLRDGIYVIFNPTSTQSSSTREFLSQISSIQVRGDATDLEKLTLFLEAARKLNTTGVVDEILVTLLDATLRLTRSERGYVFLRDDSGRLRLAAGRNAQGEALVDDSTISHSILEEAAAASSEFVVSDTTKQSDLAGRQSIMAYDLRTVICIPLRKVYARADKAVGDQPAKPSEAMGVLYLDSRFASRDISTVSHDILRAIATEAAALVENAKLAQAEEAARLYQQELAIAAYYQQQLMAVTIPEVPFASLQAKNLSCKEIGGDFYDVIVTEKGLAMVITDVCGKGISAAILASIIQGMVYSQLMAQLPLQEVVTSANRFLCQKELGAKYATVIVGRLSPAGELEFVNCGHVQPLLVSEGKVVRLQNSNFPVGLLPDATYEAGSCRLKPGDRLIMVTDGVTEAENAAGDFFGDERLEQAAAAPAPFQAIFDAVNAFRGEVPLSDDCTVFELTCRGKGDK
ncbi:MAG TPA: SpoIIE family protein phosphatase [Terriglobales bacterium]|nr:SpoIIE family protein phosphatase [Terriglobales bacterium]